MVTVICSKLDLRLDGSDETNDEGDVFFAYQFPEKDQGPVSQPHTPRHGAAFGGLDPLSGHQKPLPIQRESFIERHVR